MMGADTPASQGLEGSGLSFEVVRTERASSAEESAAFQGIALHQLLRTIVLRRNAGPVRRALVLIVVLLAGCTSSDSTEDRPSAVCMPSSRNGRDLDSVRRCH